MDQLKPPTGFFAYPSSPVSIPEAVGIGTEQLNNTALVQIRTWQQCCVTGNVVIQELCKEIAKADFFCADITGMNANVMFELGFAIARDKRIWLALDTSYVDSTKAFEQIRILTTVGYASYHSSSDLVSRFLGDGIYQDLQNTIFRNTIEPNFTPTPASPLLYLKSRHDIEASVRITGRLESAPMQLITDDPRESAAQPLAWYGKHLYSTQGVVCHLTNPDREGAMLHNARYALVAGMALGLQKPLLMLAEGNFLAPVDYRDLLRQYRTAAQATKHLEEWLVPLEDVWRNTKQRDDQYAQVVKLATELRGLQLGEYIAENEAEQLVSEYFVETAAYREALARTHTIFVGRKGSGKTANLLKLADELRRDRQNLVCVIKPVAYELQGIVDLMRRYKERDLKGYAVEALWKFLLYSEIAKSATELIERRPDGRVDESEVDLLDLIEAETPRLRDDFSIRLERCVGDLLAIPRNGERSTNTEASRLAISEALHSGIIAKLRAALGKALQATRRTCILVDNLDKAWDRGTEVPDLAEFLLGLLGSANRVQADFRREDSRREKLDVSLAIFLRSDIFYRLMEAAREPDKIKYTKLAWNDPEMLLRIVEDRFVASHGRNVDPTEMWRRYFCPTIRGVETKTYLVSQILPRPRDLVFFVKAAVGTAVNRRHIRVEEGDVLEAQKQYSQYALDSVLAEEDISTARLQGILFEFIGCQARLSETELDRILTQAKVPSDERDGAVDELCSLSFLGVEASEGDFRFANDPQEHRKNLVLARRLAKERGRGIGFMINQAFWAFLETVPLLSN